MCHYIRLSGGAHGFADATVRQAAQAAAELGAVREVVARVRNRGYPGGSSVFSISYFNEDDLEILYYSIPMGTIREFDPPREVASRYLTDHTI